MVCPLCENVQDRGDSCERCGWSLRSAERAPEGTLPGARLEGLEPTISTAIEVATERLPELEPTTALPFEGASERYALSAADWVEHTALVEPPQTPPALARICRYCRSPVAEGQIFCEQCGMKIEVTVEVVAALQVSEEADEALRRCPFCGVKGGGDRCVLCGTALQDDADA